MWTNLEGAAPSAHWKLTTTVRNLVLPETAIHPPPVLIPRGPGCLRRTAISNHNFPNAATAYPRNHVARSAVLAHVDNFSKRRFSSNGPIASVARSETQLEHKTDEDDLASRRSARRSTIRPVAMHQLSRRPNRREQIAACDPCYRL